MIRPYESTDLEAVLDVWFRASVIAHSFLPAEFFERERREIAERWMPAAETFVAEMVVAETVAAETVAAETVAAEDASSEDSLEAGVGRVVGFVSLIGNEVGAIFVDPDEQGRGVGRALMDAARAVRPYLELDVFEANAAGRHFYDAYGFEAVGRSVNEVAGYPELRLRMEGSAGSSSSSEQLAD